MCANFKKMSPHQIFCPGLIGGSSLSCDTLLLENNKVEIIIFSHRSILDIK